MSWLSDLGKSLGAGLVGGGIGFLVGGPVGALAGFGIGAFSSAAGMSGSTSAGTWGGAAIGGLAGFAIGGPVGAVAGGLLGALFGRTVAGSFNQQPQQPPYAQQFPPYFPSYGNMPFFPNFGMPQGNFGFNQFPGMYGQPNINIYNYGQSCPCHPPSYGPPAHGGGTLKQEGGTGKPIEYTTSGGYKVTVNGHDVSIVDPNGKHTVTHWGDPHENVDGKHLKDWDKKTRTMVLGDGTKITMNADHPQGLIKSTSIYDGAQQIQINNDKGSIEKVGFNPWETAQAERSQADGETAFMGYRNDGSFTYKNIYNQNDDLSVERNHRDIWSEPPKPPPHSWRDDYAFIQA